MIFIIGLITFGYAITSAMVRIGAPLDVTKFTVLTLGTVLIITMGFMIWQNRKPVAVAIMGNQKNPPLFKKQFAAIWHILSFAYIIIIWVLWAVHLIVVQRGTPMAFFISLLIVPIYLLLDKAGQLIVMAILGTLKEPENKVSEDGEQTILENDKPSNTVSAIIRATIIITLILWVSSLWGINIPFAAQLPETMFDVLAILFLGYLSWNFLSRIIDNKLAEDMPDKDDNEDTDGEWGGAAIAGRSTTLLPMVKKFIGTVLVVVVILTILSSMGIEIAPLLAGAGVIGLAIGFGAQKLVTDILSGFFFLLDDAFRVGEYIQAGSVSGSVEAITLRNVKLRHHRGMLQLVPFGELGSITNFMRGGMIIKFNIQLPYDTDIDKVRKIIKKVGQAMLKDEEYGADFIRPVKSQGVREVGDSVMTFRVKFTAKPGKQFVIQREAFRRITEALAAKGIHYAHRKVIVDMPEELKSIMEQKENDNKNSGRSNAETPLKIGAAAAVDGIIRREENKKTEDAKK
ncbi:MAG: mechanosensitive ion channel family protein [Desulfobacula sp.]|nr:mechanosensitive ion channel family protein [Desulfobacula sp.]